MRARLGFVTMQLNAINYIERDGGGESQEIDTARPIGSCRRKRRFIEAGAVGILTLRSIPQAYEHVRMGSFCFTYASLMERENVQQASSIRDDSRGRLMINENLAGGWSVVVCRVGQSSIQGQGRVQLRS